MLLPWTCRLSQRLLLRPNDDFSPLPAQLLRKYIAYARQYVSPRLTDEALQASVTAQTFHRIDVCVWQLESTGQTAVLTCLCPPAPTSSLSRPSLTSPLGGLCRCCKTSTCSCASRSRLAAPCLSLQGKSIRREAGIGLHTVPRLWAHEDRAVSVRACYVSILS